MAIRISITIKEDRFCDELIQSTKFKKQVAKEFKNFLLDKRQPMTYDNEDTTLKIRWNK